jgi:L-fuculose-phosphate aldolase
MSQEVLLRKQLIATTRAMNDRGLNQGTSGNVAVRVQEPDGAWRVLITPTGMSYGSMDPEDIVELDMNGAPSGKRRPSSEWRIHLEVLRARPEVHAVLHAHPMFSTTLACIPREIPAFHYMVAVAGGKRIPCAPYATFGSPELAANVVAALEGVRACLLANHGMVAVGASLERALSLAVEVETLAAMYWRALQVGTPALLDDAEMTRILDAFRGYGQPT